MICTPLRLAISIVLATAATLFAQPDENMEKIGSIYNFWARAYDVYWDQETPLLLYVATGNSGVRILDISDPVSPVELGWCDTRYSAEGVTVRDGLAYVADNRNSLLAIDVSDPTNPYQIGRYDPHGSIRDVLITDSLLLALDDSHGLYTFDVSDATTPREIDLFQLSNYCAPVDASTAGDLAFVAWSDSGLRVLHTPTVGEIAEVGHFLPDFRFSDIALAGDIAFLADYNRDRDENGGGVMRIDISDPANPREIGTTPLLQAQFLGIDGDRLGVIGRDVESEPQFHLLDIGNPEEDPQVIGSLDLSEMPLDIAMGADSLVFIADGGLSILKYDDEQARMISRIDNSTHIFDVVVEGEIAYIAAMGGGLRVVDVRDPASPREIGRADVEGSALAVEVANGFAYVAADEGGLYIFDVEAPNNPRQIYRFETVDRVLDLTTNGDLVCLAVYHFGIVVLDCTDPFNPVELYRYENRSDIANPVINQDYLHFGIGSSYHILSLRDPENPTEVASLDLGERIFGIAISGNSAYFACYRYLILVDITDLRHLQMRGQARLWAAEPSRVAAEGSLITATTGSYGTNVYDCSDPRHPDQVGFYAGVSESYGVDMANGLIYVAGYSDLSIYRYTGEESGVEEASGPPTRFILDSIYPNPFNSSTTISYSLPVPGSVSLVLYDHSGRKVRELGRGFGATGSHSLVLDASDLTSGLYFVRLNAGGRTLAERVEVIR